MQTVDRDYAARVLRGIIATYPHDEPKDPEWYSTQMMLILIGKPIGMIKDICHPEIGVVATCKSLPTPAHVNEWIRKQARWSYAPEHKRLPPPEPREQLSPEERAKRAERLKDVAKEIRAAVKHMAVGRPPAQQHNPGKLLNALSDLKKMQSHEGGSE